MTTTTTKQADHYIIEWAYWAKSQREQFDNLNDAMAKAEEMMVPGVRVRLFVVFTDGSRTSELLAA